MMSKFKLKLPFKISDLRESIHKLNLELSLMQNAYRKCGATSAQGQLLLEIDRSEPINLISLAAIVGLDKSTVSQTLSQLANHGWVSLTENTKDRRYKTIELSEKGRELVNNINQQFDQQFEDSLNNLKTQEKNSIAYGIGLYARVLEDQRFHKDKTKEDRAKKRASSDLTKLGRGIQALIDP